MNQKEQIELWQGSLGSLSTRLKNDRIAYTWIKSIMEGMRNYISALTTPQPEASDREMAKEIRDFVLSAEERYEHGIGCLECWSKYYEAEIASNIATIRADERRKADAEIAMLRDELKRANDTLAEVAAQRNLATEFAVEAADKVMVELGHGPERRKRMEAAILGEATP
jgi:hypothetical protein